MTNISGNLSHNYRDKSDSVKLLEYLMQYLSTSQTSLPDCQPAQNTRPQATATHQFLFPPLAKGEGLIL